MYSLFDSSNFAKDSIIIQGKSIISGEDFAKRFGFSSKIQIYYNLEKLQKKDKIRFNYMLNGRGGEYGLLKKHKGALVRPGLIEVPPEYEFIFVNAIKECNVDFKSKKLLTPETS